MTQFTAALKRCAVLRRRKKIQMSASVLVGYATRYGSTQEVAEAIAAMLHENGLATICQPMSKVRSLEGFDALVLGAPLYMFRWHKDAKRFLSRHRQLLMARPVAVFALGPLHDDPKEWQDSRGYLDKELLKFPWLAPVAVGSSVASSPRRS
jgi:menaquinone-dependent protoporphyrinogen oxidase